MPSLSKLLGGHDFRRFQSEYYATVIDNNDPEQRHRIRVKCPEIYGNYISPWVEPSIAYGGFGDGGFVFIPEKGSNVKITFKNGDPDHPQFAGAITPNKSIPKLARGIADQTRKHKGKMTFTSFNDDSTIAEQQDPFKSKYPFNKVIKTVSHTIEMDDTPGGERLNIQHRTGSGIEMYPDGSMVVMTRKDKMETVEGIAAANIKGNADYKFDKSVAVVIDVDGNVKIAGDFILAVSGDLRLVAEGEVLIAGRRGVSIASRDDITLVAEGKINTSASITTIVDSD